MLAADMVGCGCAACQSIALSAAKASQPPVQPIEHMLNVGTTTSRASAAPSIWQPLTDLSSTRRAGAQNYIKPSAYTPFAINESALLNTLSSAPMEFTAAARAEPVIFSLPAPDGSLQRFKLVESPIMAPELAAKFPGIKTYAGQGIDNPAATLRLDYTYAGFHASVLSPSGTYYVDPYWHLDTSAYISYFKSDLSSSEQFNCLTAPGDAVAPDDAALTSGPETAGGTLRVYDLAVGATGEYTAFQGGTVALGLSAVTTAVNRITQVYEIDFSVRMQLIANQNTLIFTNSATDPYTSVSNASTTNSQHQAYVDANIGSANYDFGHVFHRGSANGLAGGIGTVGLNGVKAQGYSSFSSPVNDPFTIDYVAHEMGHQFGGRHTFNNCAGSQGDSSSLAQEPGSGSTIMAYAGICPGTNLQSNSDAYFFGLNWNQINSYTQFDLEGSGSSTNTSTGNNPPTVSAGVNYTIPARTPFALTATGSDPDGDSLTYAWEQRNGGNPVTLGTDPGSGPLFRSWTPSTSPTRTFPRLSNLLSNTTAVGETLPTTTRSLSFTVLARDNRAGGGGSEISSVISITSVNTGAAFAITSPNTTGITYNGGSTIPVTWNVSGTTANGINTANVNILLSLDGGNTWPVALASSTANDGSENVQLPFNTGSTTARIKVEAVGNVFFDINNFNFTLNSVPSIAAPLQPVLLAASDTGISSSDRITRLNNGSGGSTLQFSVDGTIAGANVNLYADGVLIGTALASGTTTIVTTNGSTTILDGARSITARNQQGANPPSADSPALSVTIDTAAPTFVSPVSFVYATQPHKLVYSFSEDVSATLGNADVSVVTVPGGSPVAKSFSYNGGTNQGTFDFGAILADGDYQADLTGAGVTDAAGNPMANSSAGFFFLQGDADHDRDVDLDDFNTLAINFGQSPRDFTQADFTYNGVVDLDDFNVLAIQFGTSLAPSATALGSAARTAASRVRTATGTPAATLRGAPIASSTSTFGDMPIGSPELARSELLDLLESRIDINLA